jgi:hypothetical protein
MVFVHAGRTLPPVNGAVVNSPAATWCRGRSVFTLSANGWCTAAFDAGWRRVHHQFVLPSSTRRQLRGVRSLCFRCRANQLCSRTVLSTFVCQPTIFRLSQLKIESALFVTFRVVHQIIGEASTTCSSRIAKLETPIWDLWLALNGINSTITIKQNIFSVPCSAFT